MFQSVNKRKSNPTNTFFSQYKINLSRTSITKAIFSYPPNFPPNSIDFLTFLAFLTCLLQHVPTSPGCFPSLATRAFMTCTWLLTAPPGGSVDVWTVTRWCYPYQALIPEEKSDLLFFFLRSRQATSRNIRHLGPSQIPERMILFMSFIHFCCSSCSSSHVHSTFIVPLFLYHF